MAMAASWTRCHSVELLCTEVGQAWGVVEGAWVVEGGMVSTHRLIFPQPPARRSYLQCQRVLLFTLLWTTSLQNQRRIYLLLPAMRNQLLPMHLLFLPTPHPEFLPLLLFLLLFTPLLLQPGLKGDPMWYQYLRCMVLEGRTLICRLMIIIILH